MDAPSNREENPDGIRLQNRSLGILLGWDAHLLESVPCEEGVSALILLTRPIERGFEHPQVSLNRIGSDPTASNTPAPSPHHVIVNSIRCQLAHELGAPEELCEVPASLSDVLEIELGLGRPVR